MWNKSPVHKFPQLSQTKYHKQVTSTQIYTAVTNKIPQTRNQYTNLHSCYKQNTTNNSPVHKFTQLSQTKYHKQDTSTQIYTTVPNKIPQTRQQYTNLHNCPKQNTTNKTPVYKFTQLSQTKYHKQITSTQIYTTVTNKIPQTTHQYTNLHSCHKQNTTNKSPVYKFTQLSQTKYHKQVTSIQIYTTVTKQNTTNRVQNNKTQITFTYKQYMCTLTAMCSWVFACGCYN